MTDEEISTEVTFKEPEDLHCSVLFKQNYLSTAHVVVNQGGTSSGKTFAIEQALFCLAGENPKQVITIVGQDIPNLKAGALRDAINIYSSSAILQTKIKSYNKSDRIFEFFNGSSQRAAAGGSGIKRGKEILNTLLIGVPRTRFELVHPYECHPLKMVRLPISPPGLLKKCENFSILTFQFLLLKKGVPEERLELSRDNSQRLLRPQRLPISPSGLIILLTSVQI
jgi:hypothetical protein